MFVSAPNHKRYQRTGTAENLQNRIPRRRRPAQFQVDHLSGRGILQRGKIHVFIQDRAQLPSRAAQGEMLQQGLPPEHRPGGERLSQHPQGGLEARAHHQRHRLRIAVLVLGAESGGPIEQGGGERVASEPAIVRAKCSEDDARRKPQWCLFRAVS